MQCDIVLSTLVKCRLMHSLSFVRFIQVTTCMYSINKLHKLSGTCLSYLSWNLQFDLNIFYFIYMKRDWAEHRCYVKALS